MNKIIFFISIFFFSTVLHAGNECVSGANSKGKSGIGKLGTSYDFSTNTGSGYDINAYLSGINSTLKVGSNNTVNLNINNMPYGAKPSYFWRDSCSGRISSLNDDCTKVELDILRDIESDCHLQVEVQDGLGHSKIATLQYQIDTSSNDYDYKLEVSPKYIEGEFHKESIFTLALKHNKPAYEKTVTLEKKCYFNGNLEWSDSLTYDPGYSQEHEWGYIATSGYGLRRCDLSILLDSDIDNSNNSASVFINISDPNPPPSDNKDIYIKSASVSKFSNIAQGDSININAVQAFSGTTSSHFVSSLGYVLSNDQRYSNDDLLLATDRSGLNNEEPADDEDIRWNVPQSQTAGTYYILLVSDYLNEYYETNEDNNVYPIKITIISQSKPDLFFSKVSLAGKDSQIELGAATALTVQLVNSGDKASSNGTIKFYRSVDSNISTSDTHVASSSFNSVGAGQLGDSIYRGLVGSDTVGEYWYGACVTPVSGEINTANNCSTGQKVTVTEGKPELRVNSLSIASSVQKNQNTATNIVIANTGKKASSTTSVAVYVSNDNVVDRNDTNIGESSVSDIAANSTKTVNSAVSFPIAGNKWTFACVYPVAGEKDTSLSSNCSTPKRIIITEPVTGQAAKITSPTNNSALSSSTITFQWNNVSADRYYLYVGSTEMKSDIYSGSISSNSTSKTITNLPANGNNIYVTLWTLSNNRWKNEKFTYTAKSSSNSHIDKFFNEFTWYFGSKSGANYSCGTSMVCQNFTGGWNAVNKTIRVRLSDNYLYWKVGNGNWSNAGVRY